MKRKRTVLETMLIDALREIIANMIDTEDDHNPETGEYYQDFLQGGKDNKGVGASKSNGQRESE